MKQLFSGLLLAVLFCLFVSCEKDNSGSQDITQTNDEIIKQAKASKTLNSFDQENCNVFWLEAGSNSPDAQISKSCSTNEKAEGEASFKIQYRFSGKSKSAASEFVLFEEVWADYRPDLSFHPLALSLWVKGQKGNNDVLRIMIIQDDNMNAPSRDARQYFYYTDEKILSNDGWQRLVIPYEKFKLFKGKTSVDQLDLTRFVGYRIDVVNQPNTAHSGEFLIEELQQLTTYEPEYKPSRFSSLFIQLNRVYENEKWDQHFIACKELGIDTWIIQYTQGFGAENNVSWYSGTKALWNQITIPVVDEMVKAAERQNFKLIFGLYGGDYPKDVNDASGYEHILERNKLVVDELYEKFGSSPCFDGWYITEEFHDGTFPAGWHNDPARTLLASYLQNLAAYAKAKPVKFPVQIAPALFRGMPADMCGAWFKSIFEQTPDIDVLYLQDIGGRCLVDIDVDLPNYFAHIKKACDETGVQFGVDVESFQYCWCPDVPYHAKKWEDLEEQLLVAGMFTDRITNFSWATFKPGLDSFEGYRKYLKQHNLIK